MFFTLFTASQLPMGHCRYLTRWSVAFVVSFFFTVTMTLDPCPPKSNQFILGSERTFMQSLKIIPHSVVEISRSQERPGGCAYVHWTDG